MPRLWIWRHYGSQKHWKFNVVLQTDHRSKDNRYKDLVSTGTDVTTVCGGRKCWCLWTLSQSFNINSLRKGRKSTWLRNCDKYNFRNINFTSRMSLNIQTNLYIVLHSWKWGGLLCVFKRYGILILVRIPDILRSSVVFLSPSQKTRGSISN